ncbi:uncharacterized protein LOC143433467 [Xylocopa sonorina]|uniref:uncharacterized protein LOC143433467 n=1 Tax=Xylocopa sonorina TaxID=1818115 RepID=UPI00403AC90F
MFYINSTIICEAFMNVVPTETFADDAEELVGARDASPGQFPYVVSLRMFNRHVCGGAIIDQHHILTAAHCVVAMQGYLNLVIVVSGTTNLQKGGTPHKVVGMWSHPDYNGKTKVNNDIGVIKLASPISYNNFQKAVPLASARPPVHSKATVSAWGKVSTNGQVSNSLQYLNLNIIDLNQCRKYHELEINNSAICTFNGVGTGLCNGDSGSPLVYNGRVVGVVSRGIPCAQGAPDVFTSVSDTLSFINKFIDNYIIVLFLENFLRSCKITVSDFILLILINIIKKNILKTRLMLKKYRFINPLSKKFLTKKHIRCANHSSKEKNMAYVGRLFIRYSDMTRITEGKNIDGHNYCAVHKFSNPSFISTESPYNNEKKIQSFTIKINITSYTLYVIIDICKTHTYVTHITFCNDMEIFVYLLQLIKIRIKGNKSHRSQQSLSYNDTARASSHLRRQYFLRHLIPNFVSTETFAEVAEQIIGGNNANPGQFPYQVSLRQNGRHFCGGTLVTQKHVVTAAHCIRGIVSAPYHDFTVVTGTISLKSGGQSHRVAAAVYNPDFKPTASESFANDVAVVTLADTVRVNSYQRPISLTSMDPPVGAKLTLSGWGRNSNNQGTLPDILQTTTVTLLSNADCQKQIPQQPIYGGHLCAFQRKGVGACNGDSGGPLVYNGKLVGIVSWVVPCAQGYPDGYTRVTHYLNFINQHINYVQAACSA